MLQLFCKGSVWIKRVHSVTRISFPVGSGNESLSPRALILRPQLIVLDEPTSALDRSIQKQILALLISLQKEFSLSYLFISHDLSVVKAISHRVLVMHAGEIIEQGTTSQIFEHAQHKYTQTLLSCSTM